MRLSDFWFRMEKRFGATYAHSIASDYRVSALGATISEALTRGDDPKEVWRAVSREFDVSTGLR